MTIHKKPWAAGLLSLLLPGLGHFYIRQLKKAIGFHAGLWIVFVSIWFLPLSNSFFGLIIIACLVLIYDLIIFADAIISTRKNKIVELEKYDKWYVYLLIIVGLSLAIEFVYLPAKTRWSKFQFANYPTSAMAPSLIKGDRFTWKRTKEIQRNNITVFRFPVEPNDLYVFRCVATPGDRLEIKQGQVYLNGDLSGEELQLKFQYQIQTDGKLNFSKLEELGYEEIIQIKDQGYICNLTNDQAKEIKQMDGVIQVVSLFKEEGTPNNVVFPYDLNLNWNEDFFGSVKLPQKGETIEINHQNAVLYGTIIQMSENEPLVNLNDQGLLEINGQPISSYTFKHGYFFMMGDNRHAAADSRYLGLVPDDLIEGKALYIWWSTDKGRIGKEL